MRDTLADPFEWGCLLSLLGQFDLAGFGQGAVRLFGAQWVAQPAFSTIPRRL